MLCQTIHKIFFQARSRLGLGAKNLIFFQVSLCFGDYFEAKNGLKTKFIIFITNEAEALHCLQKKVNFPGSNLNLEGLLEEK